MLVRITDLHDRRLRPYSGMTDGQLRRGEGFRRDNPDGLFIGESARVIERALDAGLRPLSLLVEERWLAHERHLIERIESVDPAAPVFLADVAQFHELTGYEVVRGALAVFARSQTPSLDVVLEHARCVAVLDGIGNYANMGALFRSAAALGLDAVLVTPTCHDPYYRRCARVSMGAVFQVPWTRIGQGGRWEAEGARLLSQRGFTTVALALRDDATDFAGLRAVAPERTAVVLGTEGEGLSAATIESCDMVVRIPMAHGVDSLNVAAAGAIAFWELSQLHATCMRADACNDVALQ